MFKQLILWIRSQFNPKLRIFEYFKGNHADGKIILKTYVAETITECDELFEEEFGINPVKNRDITVAVKRL